MDIIEILTNIVCNGDQLERDRLEAQAQLEMRSIEKLALETELGDLSDILHLIDEDDLDLDLEGRMPTEDDVLEWQGKGWLWE